MAEWDPVFLYWLGVFSLLTFFATLAIVPWVLLRIPSDYFAKRKRPALRNIIHNFSVVQLILFVAKNVIGVFFVLLGFAMLLLPGQGILMIMLGIALMNFPGKFRLERWLVSQGRTLELINRFRVKHGRIPLVLSE